MEELTPQEVEIIRAARTLLSDPDRWSRGAPSLDQHGRRVKPRDPTACQWCIYGALAHFSPAGLISFGILEYLDKSAVQFSPTFAGELEMPVHQLNDEVFDHDTLLRFFDFMLGGPR